MRTLGIGILLVVLWCPRAHALSEDFNDVVSTSLWGAAGGTALGLIAFPLTGEFKNIFVGSSIGLYLGIAAGIYMITHRNDPGNPLAKPSRAVDLHTQWAHALKPETQTPWISYSVEW